jgi:FkbM family methyltransferase
MYARFYIGRGIAYLFRFASLRLARIVFHGVKSPTFLERRYYGYSLFLDVSRSSAQQLLWLQGERFVKERSLIRQFVRPSMMVIDVGANIGYYALLFGALMQNTGRIICLEPDPSNLNELRLNVNNNHLEKLVAIEAVAAGSYDGSARFAPGLNSYASPTGSMTVPIRKIDSLSLSKVDFIKIDVEGYEGAVLDGAIETIGKFYPTVFLELHPHLLTKHTHKEIISTLKNTYGQVMAYRPRRGNVFQRILQVYGVRAVNEIVDLELFIRSCELGRASGPCWVVAQQ